VNSWFDEHYQVNNFFCLIYNLHSTTCSLHK
jgi:hypothetical protein